MRVVSDTILLVALVCPPNLSRSTSPTVVPSRCNTNSVSCFNGPSVNRFGIIRPVLHFVIPSSKQEVHYSQFYIGTEVLLLNTFFRTMTSIFSASFLLQESMCLCITILRHMLFPIITFPSFPSNVLHVTQCLVLSYLDLRLVTH